MLPIPESRDQVEYHNYVNNLIKNLIIYQDEIFINDGGIIYEKYLLTDHNLERYVVYGMLYILWMQKHYVGDTVQLFKLLSRHYKSLVVFLMRVALGVFCFSNKPGELFFASDDEETAAVPASEEGALLLL